MGSRFDGYTLEELENLLRMTQEERVTSEREAQNFADRMKPYQDQRAQALSRAGLCRTEATIIQKEIERRRTPRPEPTVTDHALLRYIERVCEIDIDALRAHILTPKIKEAIQSGATAVKTAEFLAVVKGNAITTITVPEDPPERKNNKLTRAQRERLEQDDIPDNELCESDWIQRYAR